MSNMLRKVRRNNLKSKMKTNKIQDAFHRKYGYILNVNKVEESWLIKKREPKR